MEIKFDPALFAARIRSGEFDGRLTIQLKKLTIEQLEQVALLLTQADRHLKPEPAD
jgi:hypothetical protein